MAQDADQDDGGDDAPPEGLTHAGAVVDKAIEYMTGQNIGSLAVASALLGGALGLLARTLDDDGIARVLENAIASVRSGELRRMDH
jgi:hypothetical protein